MNIPARYRKLVYAIALVAAVGVFAAGIVTPEQVGAGVEAVAQITAALAAILALLNVTPDE